MPIGFSKRQTVKVYLPGDEGVEGAPHFICRYMSCLETIEYEEMLVEAAEKKKQREGNESLNQAIATCMVGWEGMRDTRGNEVPYAPDAIDRIYLTPAEKWTLAYTIPKKLLISENELKNSESQQGEQPESSAPSAPAENA